MIKKESFACDNSMYNAIYNARKDELIVGEIIPSDIDLSFIRSNRGVTLGSFDIRDIDRKPIGGVNRTWFSTSLCAIRVCPSAYSSRT